MKWSELELRAETFAEAARRTGKTGLTEEMMTGYLDWIARGSPPDEEIPPLTVRAVRVGD